MNTILLIVKRHEFYKHASKSYVQHTLSANAIDQNQCVEIVTVSILDELSVLEKVFYFAFSFFCHFFFVQNELSLNIARSIHIFHSSCMYRKYRGFENRIAHAYNHIAPKNTVIRHQHIHNMQHTLTR